MLLILYLIIIIMKTINRYWVEVPTIIEYKLMKYIDNNRIAMNTKTDEERKQVVLDFIEKETLNYNNTH